METDVPHKIASIKIFQVDLPLYDPFEQSGGRVVESMDTTIIAIETENGIVGWGESCPWGPDYLPAFAEGIRAALELMAERLIGLDASNITQMRLSMDRIMTGQVAAKHAIETACWDILGKASGLPLYALLGGKVSMRPMRQGLILFSRGRDAMKEMVKQARAEGRPHFELKMSGDAARDRDLLRFVTDLLEPDESMKVDANGGWTPMEAASVMAIAPDMNFQFEQPCADLEQIRALRRLTNRPIYIDESAVTLAQVASSAAEGVINGVNVKLARVGGISMARAMRDLCAGLGLPVIVQCTGGSEISAATIAHVAHSTRPDQLVSVWNPSSFTGTRIATGMETGPDDPDMRAGSGPGLGLTVDLDVLGAPAFVFS